MLNHSTDPQPSNALQYANFVQSAYETFTSDETMLNPNLTQYKSFPDGYNLIANIQMSDSFQGAKTLKYYGFIAQSKSSPGSYVVAFRGTVTLTEWWEDFQWGLLAFPWRPNSGNVASGFLDIYNSLQFQLPGSTTIYPVATSPLPPILGNATSLVTVGHSLGSALATIHALDTATRTKMNPNVYTLASPRVGDSGFTTVYNNAVGSNYRIYNWPDIVPNFPKDASDNYQHVKGGYEVDSLEHPLTVKIRVDCFHELSTYQYLLGADPSILGGMEGCGV